ncbi:GDP dissociation inhibitor-domain-containing protein [Lipomyces kononenkoae]|uniref:GDP dissociation inhibitor-domain-containing protein n=1 Tax=Lipomyces kononenkoae TaxID=34357 RepID=A0ACC3T5V6_LIPKO
MATSTASATDCNETCDVLIYGTGLVESVVAAALAWQGTNVLHIDSNPYYGGAWAALNLDELKAWTDRVNSASNNTPFLDAYLYISRNLDPRKYAIDLSPHILFTRSDLLSLLIKSRVSRYLEFKPLGSFHTFEQDSFEKVPGTKEDIFTSQTLTLLTKRSLMRFMKFVIDWEQNTTVWQEYKDEPISKFLEEKFGLDVPQIVELVHSIGLLPTPKTSTEVALAKIKRYLTSMQVYGNFPAMYSMYGTGGELAQGFCRSAAVAGAVYRLGSKLVGFDETTGVAELESGEKIKVAEKIISSETVATQDEEVTRMVAVVEKDCKEWFAEGESAAIVVFPVDTLDGNQAAVQVLVMGSGSGQCPSGQAIWYLSIQESGELGRKFLYVALEKLEEAILRESTQDFEFAVNEEEIAYLPNGLPVISSVRLGESLRNFTPKESLKYLLKLTYSQKSTVSPIEPPADSKLIYSAAPCFSLAFEDIVDQAKGLYELVTGTTDDFFDVDFEDEDDDATVSAAAQDTEAREFSDDKDEDVGGHQYDFEEVAGEMTI